MINLPPFFPLAAIVATALLILLVDALGSRKLGGLSGPLAITGFAVAFLLNAVAWEKGSSGFSGALMLDGPAVAAGGIVILIGILVVLIGLKFVPDSMIDGGAYHALLTAAIAGLVIMVSSGNLLVIVLGLELLSVSSYALAALKKDDPESVESGVKYFMMGSLAAAFTIFGLAFIYGASGSLEISMVRETAISPLLAAGLGLVAVGLAFKVGLVPFHMWAPDVYQGAPTPISAFFATATKVAGFIAVFRIMSPGLFGEWQSQAMKWALAVVAALTMIVGSLAALRQQNVKRLLAYSSIVHSGYVLLAVISGDGPGMAFYLAAYSLVSIGAFGSVLAAGSASRERLAIRDYSGLATTSPWNAAVFSIFLLSLAGFPPTGGFLAKFLVFSKAVERGYAPLVIIAVLASLVSVYYYLRLIAVMYMRAPEGEFERDPGQPGLFLVLFLCLIATIQLGIMPGNLLAVFRAAFAF